MKFCKQVWQEDDGVLTFEWVLLVTLLTIGIAGGIAGARDAVIDELGDVAQAMIAMDQSYSIDYAPDIVVHTPPVASGPSDSSFTDAADYVDCERALGVIGQNFDPTQWDDGIDGG
jgi:hypothetical protein